MAETMDDVFGTPSFGGARLRIFKIKDGDGQIYRILPPFKSCRATGEWAKYYSQHYGWKGVSKKDASKTVHRPFKCIEEKNRDKMITKECKGCTKVKAQIALRDERKASIDAEIKRGKKYSEADVEELMRPLEDWIKEHNIDRKWWINVMNEKRECGVLLIAHRHKAALDAAMEKLQKEEGISKKEMMEPKTGVWWDFGRTGSGNQTQHTVAAVYETEVINNKRVRSLKTAPLTNEDLQNVLANCADLNQVVRTLTADQIEALVGGSGDPEEVDAIFDMGMRSEQSATREPVTRNVKVSDEITKRDESGNVTESVATYRRELVKADPPKVEVSETRISKAEPKVEVKASEPEIDPEEAELVRRLEEKRRARAKLTKADPQPPKPAPVEQSPVLDMDVDNMSDEDIARTFGSQLK